MPDELEIKFSRDEMIERLRVDPEFAGRLWSAFGFAADPGTAHEFTEDDLAALAVFVGSDAEMDPGTQLAAARVMGQSTARLAEWQAEQIRALAADPRVPLTTGQLIDAVAHVQQLVWRRHLNAYLARDEVTAAAAEAEGAEVIIGFADIVGYTSLSRRLGLRELDDLLETFESGAHRVITEHGGAVVKAIGDAVMFTAPDAPAAAETAIGLHALTSDGALPSLRIGLASGVALTRMGDVFGEPVNIAARLASAARSGTTLVDDTLAAALAGDRAFYLNHLSALSVRGYRRLRASALARNRHADDADTGDSASDRKRRAKEEKAEKKAAKKAAPPPE